VLIQHFNSILFYETFVEDGIDMYLIQSLFIFLFLTMGNFTTYLG